MELRFSVFSLIATCNVVKRPLFYSGSWGSPIFSLVAFVQRGQTSHLFWSGFLLFQLRFLSADIINILCIHAFMYFCSYPLASISGVAPSYFTDTHPIFQPPPPHPTIKMCRK